MEENRPVYINGEPVYDTDHYTPGQKRKKATTKHLTKKPIVIQNDTLSSKISSEFNKLQQKSTYEDFEHFEDDVDTAKKDTNLGKTSMILGILAIFFVDSLILSVPLGIAAIITANKSVKQEEQTQKKIGKIAGIAAIILTIIVWCITIISSIDSIDILSWIN